MFIVVAIGGGGQYLPNLLSSEDMTSLEGG
jgi:hypothetical protein